MEMICNIIDLLSVFMEGFIVFSVSGIMCGKKHTLKKFLTLVLVFSCAYTFLMTYTEMLTEGTVSSLLIAVCCSLAVNFILSEGSMLLRCTSVAAVWFLLHSLNYVLTYSVMLIAEGLHISEKEYILLQLCAEGVKIAVFCLLKRVYPLFSGLERKYLILICCVSIAAYLLMYGFAGSIMSESVVAFQLTALFSVLFTVVSLVACVFAVTVKTGYEKEKRESELMSVANSMMEKNFMQLEASRNSVQQQVHDFKNHLLTLRGMTEDDERVSAYIDGLLQTAYEKRQYSFCGNSVIDSIINCKIAEAEKYNITLSHKIALPTEVYISAADICAVLANQLDNAIEACIRDSENDDKSIKVEIWQKAAFVFFKVTNTCKENPFNDKNELISTKNDPSGIHGYGVRNIIRTTENYGGTVKNYYKDGIFVSTAMLPNNR